MQRQTRADLGGDAEARVRFLADRQQQVVAGEPRQIDRFVEAIDQMLQMRAAEIRHVPALVDGAAQLEKVIAQMIFSVPGILLDNAGVEHRGQQTVDRALGPAGALFQLAQRERPPRQPEAVEQLNGFSIA